MELHYLLGLVPRGENQPVFWLLSNNSWYKVRKTYFSEKVIPVVTIIMNINSLKLIYFSPTQTTRKIVEGIAQGIQVARVERVDLTPPATRMRKPKEMRRDELAIIGSPVYTGRLPTDAIHRLQRLRGNNTPVVIVVVYGNRAYEDALLELRDVVLRAGFKPVAAGAFIGEHSLSNNATPIAPGRPDAENLRRTKEFGNIIHQKMRNMQAPDEMSLLQVPGNSPYREPTALPKISPVTQEIVCIKCEKCAPQQRSQ